VKAVGVWVREPVTRRFPIVEEAMFKTVAEDEAVLKSRSPVTLR
jgi:hypothetical protein